MKKLAFLATVAVAALSVGSANAQLFSEDFETGAGSSANFVVQNSNATTNQVVFGFDYSAHTNSAGAAYVIPAAPSAAGTRGLQVAVNNAAGSVPGATGTAEQKVNVYPVLPSALPNQYILKFDFWTNIAIGNASGTTEYTLWGAAGNTSEARDNRNPTAATSGGNANVFGVTGEGGAAIDFTFATGAGIQTASVAAATGGFIDSTAAEPWLAAFPANTAEPFLTAEGGATPLNGLSRWKWTTVEMEVNQSAQIATVYVTSSTGNVRTAVVTNIPLVGGTTNPFVGLYDRFASQSGPDSFIVFDNIEILDNTPPPVSAAENWAVYQ
jgi:hypothetical protein